MLLTNQIGPLLMLIIRDAITARLKLWIHARLTAR